MYIYVYVQTIVLSPTFALPYFSKQFNPLRNAQNQTFRISFSCSNDANIFAPVVKNKQYRAPEVPPIHSSAMFAISNSNVAGCDKDKFSKLLKIPIECKERERGRVSKLLLNITCKIYIVIRICVPLANRFNVDPQSPSPQPRSNPLRYVSFSIIATQAFFKHNLIKRWSLTFNNIPIFSTFSFFASFNGVLNGVKVEGMLYVQPGQHGAIVFSSRQSTNRSPWFSVNFSRLMCIPTLFKDVIKTPE